MKKILIIIFTPILTLILVHTIFVLKDWVIPFNLKSKGTTEYIEIFKTKKTYKEWLKIDIFYDEDYYHNIYISDEFTSVYFNYTLLEKGYLRNVNDRFFDPPLYLDAGNHFRFYRASCIVIPLLTISFVIWILYKNEIKLFLNNQKNRTTRD